MVLSCIIIKTCFSLKFYFCQSHVLIIKAHFILYNHDVTFTFAFVKDKGHILFSQGILLYKEFSPRL